MENRISPNSNPHHNKGRFEELDNASREPDGHRYKDIKIAYVEDLIAKLSDGRGTKQTAYGAPEAAQSGFKEVVLAKPTSPSLRPRGRWLHA